MKRTTLTLMQRSLGLLPLLMLATGCTVTTGDVEGRAAGPNADEHDLVTYWQVSGSDMVSEACTDAADWAISAPEFGDSSYLMYRVNAGGATATGQSCSTLSASSCKDDDYDWAIDGNTLSRTLDGKPIEVTNDAACDYRLDTSWTLADAGETAEWTIVMSIAGAPDAAACEAADQKIKDDAPNGLGLLGCTLTLSVGLDFEKVE